MRTKAEQLAGLDKLAKMVAEKECSCFIHPGIEGREVAFLCAAYTPRASQVVYASGGYDIWTYTGKSLKVFDLSIEDAAKLVVFQYHRAKAARIKARNPSMDIDTIMKKLTDGYQK